MYFLERWTNTVVAIEEEEERPWLNVVARRLCCACELD